MKTFFSGLKKRVSEHKFIAAVVIVLVAWGGYYAYGKLSTTATETRYVLAAVEKGTLVSSVSGTGQVSVLDQMDIKPKVSGDVTSILVKEGDTVKSGALLIKLDSTDAQKAVRDAQANLDSAKLALQKLVEPADALSLIQAQDALSQAQQSKQDAEANFSKSYDDGFNSISNAFTDLPAVVTGLDNLLHGTSVNGIQTNIDAYYNMANGYKPNVSQFRDAAAASYQAARTAYDQNVQDYKNAGRTSDHPTIDSLLSETYNTTILISDALKDTKNLIDLAYDSLNSQNGKIPAILTTHENNLQSYTATTNSHLTDLLNIQNSIKNYSDAITNANQSISEKTQALTDLKNGANPLDIQSQQLAVTQRGNALLDAQETLADYSIRAPFDGVVAKIDVNKGDPASSGAVVTTMISNQSIANVSLNEVDVAKVKVGQKATMTFDAFSGLTIAGQVSQVDTIGTVSQGVVNYNIQILFGTQDDRIKPSMSVSASIITDVKQDVLLVPNSAVKTQNGNSYVQVLINVPQNASSTSSQGIVSSIPPSQVQITTGISNGSKTEVASGLNEGDLIVTRTITGTTAASASPTAQSSSLGGLRIPGLGGGGAPAGR
ncbi:MAG: HlyD family efflux transporter periplasmic adaptor subunit [Minisyncoccia bacterium]|jgi:HlyD family secretion protein